MPIFFAIATFFSTSLGGLFALYYKDRLHRVLGFTAGVLLAVVAFDILPETFQLSAEANLPISAAMVALVVGFLFFHIIEKVTLIHHAHEEEYAVHSHQLVGLYSALAMTGHSFLDGMGIGLAFKVNSQIGVAVAIAVIAHDFSDGLNTVALMLVNRNTTKRAIVLLAADAVAPVVGALSTRLFVLSDYSLLLYLGFFAGFLLYIGASDILPQAHAGHPSKMTVAMTILGVIFIYVVTRVV
ncbi:MAG TPA: ZIP family metal transporter [Candidatus Acidoferrum sp.]|nr:ZIP family metal transporter [Candidatus Acidoferrum sp.]